ncbi:putative 28S ribosomal protein S36-like [Homarus americanus]|uniref:Putative 28S ribosomal protein S36-like n=1 Tax=Homarus americanus TaxID=6706 RepID=A0A8J5T279_HOMAM|nr:putative 28S ribosomal protein S36-like [Homarus americanus]
MMQVNGFMSSLAGAAWKAVKPHIPMIKFRKGGLTELETRIERKSMSNSCENDENGSCRENVAEVCYYVICIVENNIKRRIGKSYTCF